MPHHNLPTAPTARITLIDVIRGFAVFGILLSNILIFSGYVFTPFSILNSFSTSGLNTVLYSISKLVVSGKFYPIFCILFGYGFYMQVAKYRSGKHSFSRIYGRRLFYLLLIGALHQIIWPGDVVTTYAIVGFLFLAFQNTSAKQDLILAIFFFVLYLTVGFWPQIFPPESAIIGSAVQQTSHFSFPGIDNIKLIDQVRNGGIMGMYYFYIPQYQFLWSPSRLIFTTPSVIALFFMGGFLFKSDFFNKAALKFKNLMLFFILGAIGSYLWARVAYPFRIIDNLFLSLLYMSLIALLIKTRTGSRIFQIFVPVGRMALTSYILQSVLCMLVFYSFGLKLFAQMPLYGVYIIALVMLVFQVFFSSLWLKKFRFGPLEWIWRCLSYKKKLPLRVIPKN